MNALLAFRRPVLAALAGLLAVLSVLPAEAASLRLRGGGVAPPAYDDGSANAPAGAAQYPTALDLSSGTNELGISMAVRPPHDVSGVDFRATYPTGQAFDPVTSVTLPSGVSRDTTNKLLRVSGPGDIVLSGIDYTAAGVGWYVYLADGYAGTLTVQNSKFKIGSTNVGFIRFDTSASGATLIAQYNEFDGSSADSDTYGNVGYLVQGAKNSTIQYNHFKSIPEDAIKVFSSVGVTGATIRYNVFENASYAPGAHADMVQVLNTGLSFDMANIAIYGNLTLQRCPNGSGYPGNLNVTFRAGDLNAKTITNIDVHHNTAIALCNTGHRSLASTVYPGFNKFTEITATDSPNGFIDDVSVHTNYVWTAAGGLYNGGTQQGFYAGPFATGSGLNTTNASYGPNYNMRDGSTLTTTP